MGVACQLLGPHDTLPCVLMYMDLVVIIVIKHIKEKNYQRTKKGKQGNSLKSCVTIEATYTCRYTSGPN